VRLAPSCFNNQPWRLVFVSEPEVLDKLHETLSGGNAWARAGSLIIAGFSPKKIREVLGIPEEYQVITLIIVGKRASKPNPVLNDGQINAEHKRPERKPVQDFIHLNRYSSPA
jgi:nitroreductase